MVLAASVLVRRNLPMHSTYTQPHEFRSPRTITDEPPAEIAAAGHDRCTIKPENLEAWLNPDPSDLKSMYAILDDRERPYYKHRLAA